MLSAMESGSLQMFCITYSIIIVAIIPELLVTQCIKQPVADFIIVDFTVASINQRLETLNSCSGCELPFTYSA